MKTAKATSLSPQASTYRDFSEQTYRRILFWGNKLLYGSLVLIAIAISLSYGYASALPISVQIAAHISILLFATSIKIAYAMRCTAQYGLGIEVQ
ncbi:hypothetical protein [Agaribacterium sp. ZY112]|uniref:hypothetical protein n=1 Tax=Agaribacterium sp. ZY112 TaxID=3233574 RepID=UPI00352390A7